jgi:hypothetical protein
MAARLNCVPTTRSAWYALACPCAKAEEATSMSAKINLNMRGQNCARPALSNRFDCRLEVAAMSVQPASGQ